MYLWTDEDMDPAVLTVALTYGVIMKVLQFLIRKILYPAAVLYMLLTLVLLTLMTLTDDIKPSITLHTAGLFLLLSLLIAGCNLIFSLKQLSLLTRTLLHFPAVLLSIALVLLFNNGYDITVNSLVLVIVYTVLYLIIVPVILLVGAKIHQKNTEEKTYTSIFSPRD